MKYFYLRVTALSPLAIRADQAEGGVRTTQAIPGVTFLGSLASSHRLLRPEREDEFASFFLNEQISFPYLYPAQFDATNFREQNVPVMPLPKTAQSCKRFSGFLPVQGEEQAEERHGVRDSLLDWGVFSLMDTATIALPALLSPFEGRDTCIYAQKKYSGKICEQAMDHINGYYRRNTFKVRDRMQARVQTRLHTRTGINREWGVVEERILYNREVFDNDMVFWGKLALPDKLADSFKQFIEEASEEDVIHIGTGRTRGLGRIGITAWEFVENEDEAATFSDRVHTFDAALKQLAHTAGVQPFNRFYFAITLHSPAILCDTFLRYQKTLTTASLAELLEITAEKFQCIYQSVCTQRIPGWNELWGTPRADEHALEMGSTFLFAYDGQPDNNFIEALRKREEMGIGRRRSEGFGRILISDPFHLEREQA